MARYSYKLYTFLFQLAALLERLVELGLLGKQIRHDMT